jgi:hypothetical protein
MAHGIMQCFSITVVAVLLTSLPFQPSATYSALLTYCRTLQGFRITLCMSRGIVRRKGELEQ